MAKKRNDIEQFSAEYIRRYVEGGLSEEEKHRLERAALEDPFLADAIEGMKMAFNQIGMQNFDSDVRDLKGRLEGRRGSRPVLVWWKVAAILVVLVGGIALTFLMQKDDKMVTAIVMQESTSDIHQELDTITRVPETDSAYSQSQGAKTPPASDEEPDGSKKPGKKRGKNIENAQLAPKAKSVKRRQPAPLVGDSTQPLLSSAAEITSGPERALAAERIPDAMRETDSETRKPKNEAISDSVVQKNVAATGFSQIDTTSKNLDRTLSGRAAGVVVQNQDRAVEKDIELSEVVVTGFSPIRNAQARVRQNTASKRFAPENGWPAFHQYIQQNKRLLSEDEINNTSEVTFSVNSNGRPTDIRITQSLSKQHDDEIRRLLLEGPSWKILKGKPRRLLLRVQF